MGIAFELDDSASGSGVGFALVEEGFDFDGSVFVVDNCALLLPALAISALVDVLSVGIFGLISSWTSLFIAAAAVIVVVAFPSSCASQ